MSYRSNHVSGAIMKGTMSYGAAHDIFIMTISGGKLQYMRVHCYI